MVNETNITHNDLDTVSSTITTIHQICSTVVGILGCVLNLLMIIAILKSRLHRQSAIAFVLNFVVINCLVSAVCLPIIMAAAFDNKTVVMSRLGCVLGGFIMNSIVGSELMALILIAFNRYFLIVHFPLYQKIYYSWRNTTAMMVISWSIYPIIFLFPLTETWGRFSYDVHRFTCHPLYTDSSFGNFLISFVLLTTISTLIYCYIAIVYKVIKNRKKVEVARSNKAVVGNNKNEMQLVVTVILILTTFAILYIPFLVLGLLDQHMDKYGVVIHVVSIYIGWSHVIVNPLIYSVKNRQIKQAYRKLIYGDWLKRMASKNSDYEMKIHTVTGNRQNTGVNTVQDKNSDF